jgi:hypothetical protein
VVVTTIGPGLTEAIHKRIEALKEMVAMEEAEAVEEATEAVVEAVAEEATQTSPLLPVCYQVNQFLWS